MRTHTSNLQTLSAAACALALLAMTSGTALAAAPSTTAYHFSSHPMISGTVVTVNDREMVVNTDQGEQVTLALDTKTMAPRDLAPGMVMRAEFLALEDCRFYAQRIMPVRSGTSTNRLQAYANTQDSRETVARNETAFGGFSVASNMGTPAVNGRETGPQTIGEHSAGPVVTARPSTMDYLVSTRPMTSGTVLTVNDHQMVIETDQGQKVGVVMDSRTMVPTEVAPGSIVRVDFKELRDRRYYATRVEKVGDGVVGREQAYAHTRDSDAVLARNTSDCGCMCNAAAAMPTAVAPVEEVVTPPAIVPVVPAPVEEVPELPQTASNQPLLLLLGSLALAGAGLITIARRRMVA